VEEQEEQHRRRKYRIRKGTGGSSMASQVSKVNWKKYQPPSFGRRKGTASARPSVWTLEEREQVSSQHQLEHDHGHQHAGGEATGEESSQQTKDDTGSPLRNRIRGWTGKWMGAFQRRGSGANAVKSKG